MCNGTVLLLMVSSAVFAAMYLIFKDAPSTNFSDPAEAVMGMFMMSLGEFGDLYDTFGVIRYQALAIVI